MSCTKFKLTTVAALVLAATQAHAALYKVVEVTPPSTIDAQIISEVYGVAIQPSDASTLGNLGCFDASATSSECEGYKLAGETRNSVEAVSYREEVPFAMDAAFQYIQEYKDFERYCDLELKYSTCDSWVSKRWGTWSQEMNNLAHVNAQAFVEGAVTSISDYNSVINALDDLANPVGAASDGNSIRHAAFSDVPPTSTSESRAWGVVKVDVKGDGNIITHNVGSISTSNPNGNGSYFNSKAAIWNDTNTVSLDWVSSSPSSGDYRAQGSMRSIVVNNGRFYGVGYTTEDGNGDLQDMNASIFVSTGIDLALDATTSDWSPRVISGANVDSRDDWKYTNSVATDINNNLLVIGHVKRRGDVAENGGTGFKAFAVTDIDSPTASFLSGSLFFSGAGSEAKAVNNYNEIVGKVDIESGDKVRKTRAFIYPYNTNNYTSPRSDSVFSNTAWLLDDLTNGGIESSSNNKFRIIDASDINDAGIISGTAVKCVVNGQDSEYDTTSHNSQCAFNNGGEEKVVAVKLVPIADATSTDIVARGSDTAKVERQGAGLGLIALTILGFLGFRRK
ncbi:DUF3466 family protein [Vibrio sp. T187]|uniref:DUF3466 family protein n=1 Tax=Vibrio TaxID=662 RepID=UPI0010C9E120|nr:MULTISPECIES: DUF3466 family protein [Vibrio]MBW3697012.1 DUF3466 family protein [Vibrio sp. T187]